MKNRRLTAIRARFSVEEARELLQDRVPSLELDEPKRVFYPYVRTCWTVTTPSLWGKRVSSAWCLVDGLNGRAATSDAFEVEQVMVEDSEELGQRVDEEHLARAEQSARRYLTHATVHITRTLAVPSLELRELDRIFRPFWMFSCTSGSGGAFRVIVDAVTGGYQVVGSSTSASTSRGATMG